MDYSGLKQTASNSKLSSIDVSQLDKINAIPNKITDNVLMDGLCQEDQLYLNALMDDDSSESENDDHTNPSRRMSSTWSPMAQSPKMMMMNASKGKRLRRMRPYAITLSLEDISYIRPSWGSSKRIKRIEIKKGKKKSVPSEVSKVSKTNSPQERKKSPQKEFGVDHSEDGEDDEEESDEERNRLRAYHAFLIIVIILLVILMALSYSVDLHRSEKLILENKIKLDLANRKIEIYRSKGASINDLPIGFRTLRMNFGQGIPANLKSESCSCESFEHEANKFNRVKDGAKIYESNGTCFACLDWSMRANFQVYLSRERDLTHGTASSMLNLDEASKPGIFCYNFKWQSYDTLTTPLVDCFELKTDEQWFGLGDLENPHWPINGQNFNQTPILTNLAGEFGNINNQRHIFMSDDHIVTNNYNFNSTIKLLRFGSHINFTFFTSSGFYLGDLRSDFQPSIWISSSAERPNTREICLSVLCTERCGQSWSRDDHLNELKFKNNRLEYRVCSGANWRDLVARLFSQRTRRLAAKFVQEMNETRAKLTHSTKVSGDAAMNSSVSLEQAPGEPLDDTVSIVPIRRQQSIAEGIGLIDRTIFATSLEFVPTLDGQTLRQFVDSIYKLGLKTSPILLVDSRWQTHIGSFKLNTALFPKAKLLFDILHNKGLKIVLTVKPYIENDITGNAMHHLSESNRLYKNIPFSNHQFGGYGDKLARESNSDLLNNCRSNAPGTACITRRLSFFTFRNESLVIRANKESKIPYLHSTRGSENSYCALIDVTSEDNRRWMTWLIKNSNWLTQEADGIQLTGAHPDDFIWDDHYREGLSKLVDDLFYKENLFTIPQWTGNFGYMQLAPRQRNWEGLQSTLESVLNTGSLGFALVHPGSVWGDLKLTAGDEHKLDEQDLVMRWLQLSVFLPILQFKDLAPIDKYELHEQVQSLVKIRKVHIVPEIKKHLPFTPLVGDAKSRQAQAAATLDENYNKRQILPVIRRVWHGLGDTGVESIIGQQFLIGTDILVAPILFEGQRQRDIFLPTGFWHDELRQANVRGGKWLRNYPVDINEIAWFTRARR